MKTNIHFNSTIQENKNGNKLYIYVTVFNKDNVDLFPISVWEKIIHHISLGQFSVTHFQRDLPDGTPNKLVECNIVNENKVLLEIFHSYDGKKYLLEHYYILKKKDLSMHNKQYFKLKKLLTSFNE